LQKEKEKILRRRAVLTHERTGATDSASANVKVVQPMVAAGSMRKQMLAVETEAVHHQIVAKSIRHQHHDEATAASPGQKQREPTQPIQRPGAAASPSPAPLSLRRQNTTLAKRSS
jgi:hypothetical protein